MEPERQLAPVRSTTVRSFVIALFVGVPTVFFWGIVLIIVVGLVGMSGTGVDSCNIAHIQVQGILATTDDGISELLDMGIIASSDRITGEVEAALDDDTIQAILVDIDSPGGTPVAGDEVMQSFLDADVPVVTVVRDLGTSAAYWAAAGTDHIIASPVSDVGSIGVTMSYRELAESKEQEGSRWIDISSGAFKDAGNPERVLSEEEQAYYRRQVSVVHEYMVDRIAAARPSVSRERLAELADGRAFVGSEALELGLIDALGGFSEALSYLETTLGLSAGEAVLCEPAGGPLEGLF